MLFFFFCSIVTAAEQENDEHELLVSDEKPTLEPFEGKSIAHQIFYVSCLVMVLAMLCVADPDQFVTDTVPVDSEVVVMEEEDDETTSLMSTEKIDLSEGITIPHESACVPIAFPLFLDQ